MKDQSKWYWRWLRRGLLGLAILATLAAAVVTEENWRSKRAWENYRLAAEARGERLNWSDYAGTNIPDDQNFAWAPIFASLHGQSWDRKSSLADPLQMSCYRSDGGPNLTRDWSRAGLTQLTLLQEYYRHPAVNVTNDFPVAVHPQTPAADVLLALSKYDSAIEEWRGAAQRPFSEFGAASVDNGARFSPMLKYFVAVKRCAWVLQLRAVAELADGQNARALEDIRLIFMLSDKLRQEPVLFAHLVNIAIIAMAIQPVYEGLVQHRWSDAQLVELENMLAEKDMLANYQSAMRGELAYDIAIVENQRITHSFRTETDDGKTVTRNQYLPAAFFYQNELAFARMHDDLFQPLADVTNHLVSPALLQQTEKTLGNRIKYFRPYELEASLTSASLIKSVKKFAQIQSSLDLARVACALERYRLAHGEYPETLDGLTPQYIEKLPHDVINGQPLHYRRTEGGNYILYSVGWNEKDDGGNIVLQKDGMIDRDQGDWVWNSAAK